MFLATTYRFKREASETIAGHEQKRLRLDYDYREATPSPTRPSFQSTSATDLQHGGQNLFTFRFGLGQQLGQGGGSQGPFEHK